ncbi:MAG: hypothetical protein JWQ88_2980, partial [Rhodoferax sp.]|nr:hypothetical protein [Rhodoferax sp.]
VLPAVPGVTEPMAEHHLRRAAQEFCQRTRAWRKVLASTATTAAVRTYDMALPVDTELVRLESATLNAIDIPVWRAGDPQCGQFVFTPEGKTVTFNTSPGEASAFLPTVTLKPGNASIGVEDFLYDRYVVQISLGAVARLTADLGKQVAFEEACSRVATELWRGLAAIRPRARANFF